VLGTFGVTGNGLQGQIRVYSGGVIPICQTEKIWIISLSRKNASNFQTMMPAQRMAPDVEKRQYNMDEIKFCTLLLTAVPVGDQ
jgi:hypothetical protein